MADAAGSSAEAKAKERKEKLRELHQRRFEARKANRAEVVEEDRRSKLPKNYEARLARKQWILDEADGRKAAEEAGEDYDRNRMLEMQADKAEIIEAAKRRKKNPDHGFSTYDAMTYRTYVTATKNMKPDLEEYNKEKKKLGRDMYASCDTLLVNRNYPTNQQIDRMVNDLEGQIEKRSKYSRRRTFDPEAPTDFINERNRKFNQKLDRFYSKYTEDIRQNLERGTAV